MRKLIFTGLLFFALKAQAEELIVMPEPYFVNPSSTSVFRVYSLYTNKEDSIIRIGVKNGNVRASFAYFGTTAANMIKNFNTRNFSVNSQNKVILERLVADGYLVGDVSGDPD